mmetsp:Transcript_24702/g.64117  ORF Transcript_24702/g.64117 Transcript_24702/m.64117 type:complete len:83 (+) Transcript_24702:228-476(+)
MLVMDLAASPSAARLLDGKPRYGQQPDTGKARHKHPSTGRGGRQSGAIPPGGDVVDSAVRSGGGAIDDNWGWSHLPVVSAAS